jgi:periplasmic protein TonB
MAFADETPAGNRITSIVVVLALHAFFGWLFVSGLAVKVLKQVTGPIEILDVKEPPPPEEPPPPPPEQLEEIPPYVPPPEVNVDFPPPPVAPPVTVVVTPPPAPAPRVVEAPPPPPPPPPPPVRANIDIAAFTKELKKKFRGEFPDSVKRQMEADNATESRVRCRVYVSESGQVTDAQCKGDRYPKLENEAIREVKRFKFPPATVDGKPVGSWVDLPAAIVYRLVE